MNSWAEVVARGRDVGHGPAVDSITEEECAAARGLVKGDRLLISEEAGVDCFARWKFGLVGRFVRGTQSLAVIRAALRFYWGKLRAFEVLQANDKAWLILFDSEIDLQWALHNGPWAISGSVLFLERWYDGFDFGSPVQTLVPVWVLFPDLPSCLKTRSVAIALASRVGNPILLDSAALGEGNARTVRVKVVCDLADPVVEGSFIEVNGFTVWQRYKYGGFVRPCHKCGIIGHSHLVCPQVEVVPQRGRSKSRRKHSVSVSRDSFAKQPNRHEATIEGVREEGTEDGVTHKLVIQLSGSEEAEITVEEEAGVPFVAGGEEAPAGSPVASGAGQQEVVRPRLGCYGSKALVSSSGGSDSDEDPPAIHVSEPGTGRGVRVDGKHKEFSKTLSSSRGNRRGREQSTEASVAERFRAAGANEGGRVKLSKSHKATKVAFEA